MLRFDEEQHRYFLRNRELPSVTHIIDHVLQDLSHIPPDVLRAAGNRGTAVHKACELADLGTLDYGALDPALFPYVEAWERFKAETKFVPIRVEARVHSEVYGYAGTLDRIGSMNYRETLIDIKSGEVYPSAGVQLAAYNKAALERGLIAGLLPRYAVQLRDDGTYSLHPFTDSVDFNVFAAALQIYHFKQRKSA